MGRIFVEETARNASSVFCQRNAATTWRVTHSLEGETIVELRLSFFVSSCPPCLGCFSSAALPAPLRRSSARSTADAGPGKDSSTCRGPCPSPEEWLPEGRGWSPCLSRCGTRTHPSLHERFRACYRRRPSTGRSSGDGGRDPITW